MMIVRLCGGGVALWTGRLRGWKIKRKSSFVFSDRYVYRKWRLGFGWWLIRVNP